KFKELRPSNDFRQSWQIMHAPIRLLRDSITELIKIISEKNQPLTINEIIDLFKGTELFTKNQSQISEDIIISYLEISPGISKNPFDEYGLTEWGSIVPKRMNDKIYLILKRHKEPLHFTEIAQKINEAKFDNRKSYPPTVHNELILNDKYILVGRGIYALKEWGYKPGVVSNVLIDILKKENRPMSRDELVNQVLQQRIVKKNTIHLALTEKTKFKKLTDGTYQLTEQI
ncbi:winged helix-turn-helix domain-containing protein, partial [Patescibacteria group bacterium]|nr:winged helix-turn-helix domain-containing protein [Patescibacteria group bacterium]